MKSSEQFLTELALGRFSFNNGVKRQFMSEASLKEFCWWLAKGTRVSISIFSSEVCSKLQDKIESMVESLQYKFNQDDAKMQAWMDRTFNVQTIGRCENLQDILKVLDDSAKREQVCGIVDFMKL